MYFNTVDFGSNSFGIKTACRIYFNTTPDQLTYEQAATLVGLLKATSSYNPKLNPKNSTKRRNVVLTNLYDHGHLVIHGHKATRAQLDSLMALPMIVNPRKEESSYDASPPTSVPSCRSTSTCCARKERVRLSIDRCTATYV